MTREDTGPRCKRDRVARGGPWPWWAATPRVRRAMETALERLQAVTAYDTVFVAFQDGVTNHIESVRHRGEPLVHAGPWPLAQTYCSLVGASGGRVYIPRTTEDPQARGLAVTDQLGPTSFVGVPIVEGSGEWLGTVCGIDRTPHQPEEEDWRWLELMAQWLGALAEAERAAGLDPVTGRFSRWFCLHRAALWWTERGAQGAALVTCAVVDLDGFKRINDRWGHRCGDAVLRRVGEAIQAHVAADAVVARWGGDEFVILWPDVGGPGGLAARMVPVLAAVPDAVGDVVPAGTVTACAGVSAGPWTDAGWERVWAAADRALYRAKAQGPGTWAWQSVSRDAGADGEAEDPVG